MRSEQGRDTTEPVDPQLYPELRVRKNSGSKKIRTVSSLVGLSPHTEYGVFNNNLTNACKSVVERMLRVKGKNGRLVLPPPTSTEIFNTRLSEVKKHFERESFTTAPLKTEDFINSYKGRKRTIYQNAYESLVSKPLTIVDSHIRWFLKCEKVAFTPEKEPVPRGISPRSPRYHVCLGPYIKRIEKILYAILAKLFGGTTVFKGLNAAQRGREMRAMWDEFTNPVAIGLDASRFDQHVSKAAIEWEHGIYTLFYKSFPMFRKLLRWQLKNVCNGYLPDGSVRFTVHGRRMSGDMNTSSGNCLLMCSMVYSYVRSVRIGKFRLANDGDDCVLIIERKDLKKIKNLDQYFLDMGFNMKVEDPVYIFEQIEFCQCRPVLTSEGYVMVRNPLTALAKDCVSITARDHVICVKRWCKSVGTGGMTGTGQIPIWQEFYARMLRLAGDARPEKDTDQLWGFNMLMRNMKRQYGGITPETRHSFWLAFDIEPDRQIALESELKDRQFELSFDAKISSVRDLPL